MGSAGSSKSSSEGSGFNMSDMLSLASSFGQSRSTQAGGSTSGTFIDPQSQANQQRLANMGFGSLLPYATADMQKNIDRGLRQDQRALAPLMDPTKQVQAQSQSLKSGLGSLFRDEINPAIEGASLASGTFGGGRQGVAQGVATGKLGDVFASSLGDIVARANEGAIGAAGARTQIGQARGANQQLTGNVLTQLAGLLGGPTILSQGQSFSRADAASRNTSRSRSASTSRGGYETGQKGSGWNFGIG